MKHHLIILLLLLTSLNLRANEVEREFQQAKAKFELRDKEAQNVLKQYLLDYPYTTYRDETNLMIGVIQTEKEKFKQALKTFSKVECNVLGRDEQPMYWFYRGYALLQQGETAAAAACFKTLRDTESPYTLQGKYYYAYCSYRQGNYNRALPDFLAIEHTAQYKLIVPYYIVQIYYAQHNYAEVYERAAYLLRENPNSEYTGELHRIMGEIYYTDGQYLAAIEHLTAYEEDMARLKQEPVREDIYLLGMAQYQLENFEQAVTYLKRVKQSRDSLSENTCLHLGNAYIRLGDVEKAKLSYSAAIRFNLDKRIREEAMYNYALASYQSGTAMGESVTAFDEFLAAYPNTRHAEAVYQLLGDMYMSAKNYDMALESINRIKNPSRKLLETKQYLRYQLGADYFIQGKMPQAIDWMQQVLDNEHGTSIYKTEALYYIAEAKYRLHEYEQCYEFLRSYEKQPNIAESGNKVEAKYLMGYALFSMKQYAEAENTFRTYLTLNANPLSPTYLDAQNRIGDCCFNNRAFQTAAEMYERVVSQGKAGADYAMFQRGYALGLMRRYTEKAQVMEALVRKYPKSDYADDALYEIARAQLQDDKNNAAINAYRRLIDNYPNSNYSRKASLEVGMIYHNQQMYEDAIQAFRQTIERYPGSEEAYAALEGLEQVYVETNDIASYIDYSHRLGSMNMSVTGSEDSLTYVTAELQYMLGNYTNAAVGLTSYLSRYCQGGRYCTMATYYAADCYYRLNQPDEAMNLYLSLAELPGNPYRTETFTRIAELAYDKKDYETARTYFQQMLPLASRKAETTAALLGILRCSYFMGDEAGTIDVATRLLSDDSQKADVRNEALYNRGKAYFNAGKYGLAVVDMMPLSRDVRIETGAEAKYLLAASYFKLGSLDSAEQEIMNFTTLKTSHQYWLAKSLILLSDINVARGELFQAKQYLLSIQSNYHGEDDILSIVADKLAAIDQVENPQPNTTDDDDEN